MFQLLHEARGEGTDEYQRAKEVSVSINARTSNVDQNSKGSEGPAGPRRAHVLEQQREQVRALRVREEK